jgi:hypothetical protein
MNYFDAYVYFIFAIKIGFVLMAITHIYLKVKGKTDSDLDKKVLFWKERFEFIFVFLMSFLLIYLFNPRTNRSVLIDHETKILLYLFGFILLITADWNKFVHEAPWFVKLQSIVGNKNTSR